MAKPKTFDYKDTATLKQHLNPHSRLYSRKKTGLDARSQRSLAEAVKRSRFMGLLPFVQE